MMRRVLLWAALPLWAGCRAGLHGPSEPGPSIVLAGEPGSWRVEARGLSEVVQPQEGWGALFRLSVAAARRANGPALPAVVGRYEAGEGRLSFQPRFDLQPELEYTAVLRRALLPGAAGAEPDLVRSFVVPRTGTPVDPVVAAVYPTARPLPANVLKFYVHFSQPMARGFAYSKTRVLDASGAPVERPFLELGEELWNPEATRLTLLVDPGRIKRGLLLHEQMGSVLEPDLGYTLVVEAGWPSADRALLATETRIAFETTAADVTQPDPTRWQLEHPRASSRQPLVVRLDEPLDHALLQHMLRVTGAEGRTLEGDVTVDAGETRWSFVPKDPWEPVALTLMVDADLEDLAGNSVGRLFETRLGASAPATEPTRIAFQPLL